MHQDRDSERVLTNDEGCGPHRVARVGAQELLMLAQERIRRIPTYESEVVRLDGGEFHVLRGASDFFASKLVLLPRL